MKYLIYLEVFVFGLIFGEYITLELRREHAGLINIWITRVKWWRSV